MEAYFTVAALIVGLFAGWILRALFQRKQDHACHMCARRNDELHLWHIRGRRMYICTRCHPFYKRRFGSEYSEDQDPAHGNAHSKSNLHNV